MLVLMKSNPMYHFNDTAHFHIGWGIKVGQQSVLCITISITFSGGTQTKLKLLFSTITVKHLEEKNIVTKDPLLCSLNHNFDDKQLVNKTTKTLGCEELKSFSDKLSGNQSEFWQYSGLTLVMVDQLLQGAEGVAGRDVEPSVVQRTDLIMFNSVTGLSIKVPDRQGVAACSKRERNTSYHVTRRGFFFEMLIPIFFPDILKSIFVCQ